MRASIKSGLVLAYLLARVATSAPANDACAGRQVIPANGPFPFKTTTVDISTATTTDDPIVGSDCLSIGAASVWYEFRPAATALYTISTCANDGTATSVDDTILAVYRSIGANCSGYEHVVCADDACGPGNTQAALTTLLQADTNYYIVVWRYGSEAPASEDGQLQLIVRQRLIPPNDNCAAAIPLPLDRTIAGSSAGGTNDYQLSSTTARGPDVVYSFVAPETGAYSFIVRAYRGTDLVVYAMTNCPLSAIISSPLAVANRSPINLAEEIFCLQLTAGAQIFLVVDDNNAADPGASFTIEAGKCVRESEPNNAPAAAQPFVCGIEGSISPLPDLDYFALGTFPAGFRLFAMVDGSAATASSLALAAESGGQVLEEDSGDNAEAFGVDSSNLAGTILSNAPVYLRVRGTNLSTLLTGSEPYRLHTVVRPPLASATAETEPNNTIATANSAAYVRGALTAGDQDLFRFAAGAGDILFLSLDADPLRDGTRIQAKLSLLNAVGVELISVDDVGTSQPPGDALTWRVNDAGNYYARVSPGASGTSTGDYLLSVARNCSMHYGPLTLLPLTVPPIGPVTLRLRGIPNATYRFEGSPNLQSWTPLATRTAAADGVVTFDHAPITPRPSPYFYRAVAP